MPLTTITARVDESDKKDFEYFCASVGLNASAAINLYVKAVLREGCIPFDIKMNPDPFYSKSNMTSLKKSIRELREGKGTAHELIEPDE